VSSTVWLLRTRRPLNDPLSSKFICKVVCQIIRTCVASAALLGFAATAFCAPKDLILLAPLHSGSVYVYDLSTRMRVATLPVEDGAGVVGIAVSRDGNSLYVVDGNDRNRLRLFNTHSWHQEWEQQFRDRVLALGAKQVIHLTADNRKLHRHRRYRVPCSDRPPPTPASAYSGLHVLLERNPDRRSSLLHRTFV